MSPSEIVAPGGSTPAPSLPKVLISGAGMGLADAVPGVSGGTVLLVAGILDAYLAALAAVLGWVRRPFDAVRRRAALGAARLLVPLVAMQATALVIGVMLLVGAKPELGADAITARAALEAAPGLLINASTAPIVFAVFFALVAVTVREPLRARRTHAGRDWLLGALGALLAGGMALMPAAAGTPALPLIVLGGAIAISVMILPGISGSLALLLMGLYQPVAAAVHGVLNWLFQKADLPEMAMPGRDLLTIAAFGGGIILGLVVAVPILRAVLARAHDRTMAFLAGLMLGSLVALWPWKAHAYPGAIPLLGPMWPQLPSGAWWWPALAGVTAAVAALAVLRVVARLGAGSAGSPPAAGHTPTTHG